MKLRLALIALLTLTSVAGADEGEGARREARPPSPPESGTRPTFPTIAFRRMERDKDGGARTETTVVVPSRARLELENFGGDILVSGWNRNTMRVEAEHAEGTHIGVMVGPASVVVRARRYVRIPDQLGRGRVRQQAIDIPARVSYRLTVPHGMSLRLSGVNTQILVDGVESDVIAQSVNGSVALRGGRGDIRVGTINGGVEVVDTRGSVEANSVSQDVFLRDVEGPVRVETVKGNLELAHILSEAVEASTVSGNLRYEGSIDAGGEYRFESHSGDVTVVLPERPDVSVTVDTYRGSFQSSFPVPVREHRHGGDFEFLLGDGRAELEVASFSGAIRLLRAGEMVKLAVPPAPAPKTK